MLKDGYLYYYRPNDTDSDVVNSFLEREYKKFVNR
jgi:hypothetical protein